ncbi:related to UPF0136 membrane protein YJR085C [Hanseniaspora guilliermondii]|uniref:Related to UPF0136 membrane protein YJR085C n=1 Tax=Hanseniaspora guilliermondii TaxID=56406 RepID=A0A1L0CJD9_9ASCO|nr:related to UPF0136 membrane protein YJR085C [Hanseniaspora guilliermondii]
MEHLAFTLGGLTAAGGAMGYFKSGSKPSLMGGLAIGGLYIANGLFIKNDTFDDNFKTAVTGLVGTSAVLSALGLSRAIKSNFKKPVPLVLFSLGSIGLGYYAYKYKQFYS